MSRKRTDVFKKLKFLSFLNTIRLPFGQFSVKIGRWQFETNRLDRFFTLLLWKTGVLADYEHEVISCLCSPGMVVVDVGANIGFFTTFLADLVGTEGRVYAFEPEPENYINLKHNLALNHVENIIIENKAVSDHGGTTSLWMSGYNSGDNRTHFKDSAGPCIDVDMTSLDEYFSQNTPIDIIKIDIQGSELYAFNGMQRILHQHRPVVLFEFWPEGLQQAGTDPVQLLEFLKESGYRLISLNEKIRVLKTVEDFPAFVASIKFEFWSAMLALPQEKEFAGLHLYIP